MLGGNVAPFTTPYVAEKLVQRCNEKRKKPDGRRSGKHAHHGIEDRVRSTIALRPDLAPNHVARIKELARHGLL